MAGYNIRSRKSRYGIGVGNYADNIIESQKRFYGDGGNLTDVLTNTGIGLGAVGTMLDTAMQLSQTQDTSDIDYEISNLNNASFNGATDNQSMLGNWNSNRFLKNNYTGKQLRGVTLGQKIGGAVTSAFEGASAGASIGGGVGAIVGAAAGLGSAAAGIASGDRKSKLLAENINNNSRAANIRYTNRFDSANQSNKLTGFYNKVSWLHAYGGKMSNKSKWDNLSASEKSDLMSIYIKNGIKDLDTMRKHYNSVIERTANQNSFVTYEKGGLLDFAYNGNMDYVKKQLEAARKRRYRTLHLQKKPSSVRSYSGLDDVPPQSQTEQPKVFAPFMEAGYPLGQIGRDYYLPENTLQDLVYETGVPATNLNSSYYPALSDPNTQGNWAMNSPWYQPENEQFAPSNEPEFDRQIQLYAPQQLEQTPYSQAWRESRGLMQYTGDSMTESDAMLNKIMGIDSSNPQRRYENNAYITDRENEAQYYADLLKKQEEYDAQVKAELDYLTSGQPRTLQDEYNDYVKRVESYYDPSFKKPLPFEEWLKERNEMLNGADWIGDWALSPVNRDEWLRYNQSLTPEAGVVTSVQKTPFQAYWDDQLSIALEDYNRTGNRAYYDLVMTRYIEQLNNRTQEQFLDWYESIPGVNMAIYFVPYFGEFAAMRQFTKSLENVYAVNDDPSSTTFQKIMAWFDVFLWGSGMAAPFMESLSADLRATDELMTFGRANMYRNANIYMTDLNITDAAKAKITRFNTLESDLAKARAVKGKAFDAERVKELEGKVSKARKSIENDSEISAMLQHGNVVENSGKYMLRPGEWEKLSGMEKQQAVEYLRGEIKNTIDNLEALMGKEAFAEYVYKNGLNKKNIVDYELYQLKGAWSDMMPSGSKGRMNVREEYARGFEKGQTTEEAVKKGLTEFSTRYTPEELAEIAEGGLSDSVVDIIFSGYAEDLRGGYVAIKPGDEVSWHNDNIGKDVSEEGIEYDSTGMEFTGFEEPEWSYEYELPEGAAQAEEHSAAELVGVEKYRPVFGNRRFKAMEAVLKKKFPEMTAADRERFYEQLSSFQGKHPTETANKQKAAFKWFIDGKVDLEANAVQINEAFDLALKYKLDPMKFEGPVSIIDYVSKNFSKPKLTYVSPDSFPDVLTNKKELQNGIVVYEVQDSKEGQTVVRQIIDSHLGKESNPWCLAASDPKTGKLYDRTWQLWSETYNGQKKLIAFKDGKLIGFFADTKDAKPPKWWDVTDNEQVLPSNKFTRKENYPEDFHFYTKRYVNGLGKVSVVEIYDGKTGKFKTISKIYSGQLNAEGTYNEYAPGGQLLYTETNTKVGETESGRPFYRNVGRKASYVRNYDGKGNKIIETEGDYFLCEESYYSIIKKGNINSSIIGYSFERDPFSGNMINEFMYDNEGNLLYSKDYNKNGELIHVKYIHENYGNEGIDRVIDSSSYLEDDIVENVNYFSNYKKYLENVEETGDYDYDIDKIHYQIVRDKANNQIKSTKLNIYYGPNYKGSNGIKIYLDEGSFRIKYGFGFTYDGERGFEINIDRKRKILSFREGLGDERNYSYQIDENGEITFGNSVDGHDPALNEKEIEKLSEIYKRIDNLFQREMSIEDLKNINNAINKIETSPESVDEIVTMIEKVLDGSPKKNKVVSVADNSGILGMAFIPLFTIENIESAIKTISDVLADIKKSAKNSYRKYKRNRNIYLERKGKEVKSSTRTEDYLQTVKDIKYNELLEELNKKYNELLELKREEEESKFFLERRKAIQEKQELQGQKNDVSIKISELENEIYDLQHEIDEINSGTENFKVLYYLINEDSPLNPFKSRDEIKFDIDYLQDIKKVLDNAFKERNNKYQSLINAATYLTLVDKISNNRSSIVDKLGKLNGYTLNKNVEYMFRRNSNLLDLFRNEGLFFDRVKDIPWKDAGDHTGTLAIILSRLFLRVETYKNPRNNYPDNLEHEIIEDLEKIYEIICESVKKADEYYKKLFEYTDKLYDELYKDYGVEIIKGSIIPGCTYIGTENDLLKLFPDSDSKGLYLGKDDDGKQIIKFWLLKPTDKNGMDIFDFQTGEKIHFKITNHFDSREVNGNRIFKSVNTTDMDGQQGLSDVMRITQSNMKYASSLFEDAVPFGTGTFRYFGVNINSHDLDLMMLQTDFERVISNYAKWEKGYHDNYKFSVGLNGKLNSGVKSPFGETGQGEVNIVKVDKNGYAYGYYALEILRNILPEEFEKMLIDARYNGKDLLNMPIKCMTAQELWDVFKGAEYSVDKNGKYTISQMKKTSEMNDAEFKELTNRMASKSFSDILDTDFTDRGKFKSLNRPFGLISDVDSQEKFDIVHNGLKRYAKMTFGPGYYEAPDLRSTGSFDDVAANIKFLQDNGIDIDYSESPDQMQLIFEYMFMRLTTLNRYSELYSDELSKAISNFNNRTESVFNLNPRTRFLNNMRGVESYAGNSKKYIKGYDYTDSKQIGRHKKPLLTAMQQLNNEHVANEISSIVENSNTNNTSVSPQDIIDVVRRHLVGGFRENGIDYNAAQDLFLDKDFVEEFKKNYPELNIALNGINNFLKRGNIKKFLPDYKSENALMDLMKKYGIMGYVGMEDEDVVKAFVGTVYDGGLPIFLHDYGQNIDDLYIRLENSPIKFNYPDQIISENKVGARNKEFNEQVYRDEIDKDIDLKSYLAQQEFNVRVELKKIELYLRNIELKIENELNQYNFDLKLEKNKEKRNLILINNNDDEVEFARKRNAQRADLEEKAIEPFKNFDDYAPMVGAIGICLLLLASLLYAIYSPVNDKDDGEEENKDTNEHAYGGSLNTYSPASPMLVYPSNGQSVMQGSYLQMPY